jgi:UDP-N-acetylmuramyl pentapeptide phosphotransferase/UDP-N-acetylglucosamine-1-phosphate transferase
VEQFFAPIFAAENHSHMLSAVTTISLSFFITLIAIPAIIRVAEEKGLYDAPDARKLHTRAIASLGGVGIFMGFLVSLLLTVSSQGHPEFQYFFAAGIIIFFLGIKDDILILSPLKKFLVQLAASAILIHLGNIRIDSMHGLFGITSLPLAASLVLTYATMIVVINAFNLIDGVDGLAGLLGLLTMAIFGAYFYTIGLTAYALLAFAMGGSLAAFLIFNYNPAKIFMGDSGSLLLGLVNAILVIKFIEVADSGAATAVLPVGSSVALGVAILMVPLADTLRVFSIRIAQGRSPFSPDRNHIHHLLLDRGMNHKQVALTCLLLNAFFIGVAYSGRAIGGAPMLLFMMALCVLFLSLVVYLKKPIRVVPAKSFLQGTESVLAVPQAATKVVSINKEMVMVEN